MNIIKKITNLKKVTRRLNKRKFTRVKEIIRDYGIAELFRKVNEKMRIGDAVDQSKIHIITNVSVLKNIKKAAVKSSVEFDVLPGSLSVSRLDILTVVKNPNAKLTLEISDLNGNIFRKVQTGDVKDGGYTTFEFLPVLEVLNPKDHQPQRLRFKIYTNDADCGIAVKINSKKRGFNISEGGRIGCRIYSRTDAHYVHWLKNNTPSQEELNAQREHKFDYNPLFSIVVPLYNTPENLLKDMINSVVLQTYPNWEICLADGSSGENAREIENIIKEYNNPKIKYKKLEKNGGISYNTNNAVEMSSGDYIGFLDHDDMLAPQALYKYAELLNADPAYEFIYSDEDKVTEDNSRRLDPFFKPDFSPDMLLSFNYITHFTVIKKSLLDEIGYLDEKYNGAQDYDLVLRATEKAKKIGHISDILYHWRLAQTSTAYNSDTKVYTIEAGKAAVKSALKRRGIGAEVQNGILPNYYNAIYSIPNHEPLVSIIIANRNELPTLKKCLDSIKNKSTYKNYQIIIAENNSTDFALFNYYKKLEKDGAKIAVYNKPFNYSALNNYAASFADGEYLLFLNNDISVITPDWIEQMLMHAQRPEIGAVGAKLLYPDNTVQHGGIVLGIGPVAGHSHKFNDDGDVGAFARMAIVHDVSAVTGACMMIKKSIFDEAGGFDDNLAVAYNDVDLCLKIRAAGYYNVFTPFAKLYHCESKTRGYEDTPEKKARHDKEAEYWNKKWKAAYPYDPFYNRNLTTIFQDYSINPGEIVPSHIFDNLSPAVENGKPIC